MSEVKRRIQGHRVKALREQKGFTQTELAQLLGTTMRQIIRYEKGEIDANSEAVVLMAYHLETTADYLLGLTDDSTPRMYEEELSTEERELIIALRDGRTHEAVQRFASLSKPAK
jgi:transcriptional regulator with XRE-family HTH domain